MLWDKLEKERLRKTYYQSLTDAIDALEGGDASRLHTVYCIFAFGDSGLVKRGAKAVRLLLESYTVGQMIRLGENFRQYTSLEWSIDWKEIDLERMRAIFETEQDYIFALILGSFHPNGYFRERCCLEMAGFDGTLPYLVLRMNDWVGEIRETAKNVTVARVENCPLQELFLTFQALDKVERSERRNAGDLEAIKSLAGDRMRKEAPSFPLYQIVGYEFAVRKSVYHALFSGKILDKRQADALLDRERHSFCQSVIISGILKYYDCYMEEVDRYLGHKNVSVRRKAMEYKYGRIKNSWPGLERMLLDPGRGIRELAAFLLETYDGMDVPAFYTRHLQDENPVIPIIGLGETGTKEMAGELTAFLEHPSEKVVKSTILSIGRLTGEEGYDLYWNYLFDGRIPVVKAAYTAIRTNRIHYGAARLYEEWRKCGSEALGRYLILLILKEYSWDRLPWLICLYRDERAQMLRDKILDGMRMRNAYARVTAEQAGRIETAVRESGDALPQDLVKGIRFDLKFVTTR